MGVNRAFPHSISGHSAIPFHRKCAQRFSALFEKQRRQIDRLEHENERLQRELREEKRRNTELEKENSKLKKDLEAGSPQGE
jgi:predicted RNase H-like nuclease (RuvC/YqgF family)